jgi:branched-chain amino acid transport system substrate-binding protein
VRKAQEMVERDGCNIFTGITLSSEALAVVPKLDEWNALFISSDNGDGRLTAESFVPNFFRANVSAPMGARAVSLFLHNAPYKNFYAIGMDYAWGRNSLSVFEAEMKMAKKNFVGGVLADRHQGLLDLYHQDPPVGR